VGIFIGKNMLKKLCLMRRTFEHIFKSNKVQFQHKSQRVPIQKAILLVLSN